MFSKLKSLFGTESLLEEAFLTTIQTLEFEQEMFRDSRRCLREADSAELPYDFKKADKRINKYEREVRRQVLTHLAVAQPTDLVPGLVLVTIVIDVERIGDYTKNIADLAVGHPRPLHGGKWEEVLARVETVIDEQFPLVVDTLRMRDTTQARQILQDERETARQAEAIVSDLIESDSSDQSVSDGVALAMYARYLKRINAHLTNVASAIVNPFPRIGFREKKKAKAG